MMSKLKGLKDNLLFSRKHFLKKLWFLIIFPTKPFFQAVRKIVLICWNSLIINIIKAMVFISVIIYAFFWLLPTEAQIELNSTKYESMYIHHSELNLMNTGNPGAQYYFKYIGSEYKEHLFKITGKDLSVDHYNYKQEDDVYLQIADNGEDPAWLEDIGIIANGNSSSRISGDNLSTNIPGGVSEEGCFIVRTNIEDDCDIYIQLFTDNAFYIHIPDEFNAYLIVNGKTSEILDKWPLYISGSNLSLSTSIKNTDTNYTVAIPTNTQTTIELDILTYVNFDSIEGTLQFDHVLNSKTYQLSNRNFTCENKLDRKKLENVRKFYQKNKPDEFLFSSVTLNKDTCSLSMNGRVHSASILGYDLFPSFMGWIANNAYILPLTLVGSIISGIGLFQKRKR